MNDQMQHTEEDNMIFIGKGLNNTHGQEGSYGLFLANDFFLFKDRQTAVLAYNEYKNEAYLWDMDDANGYVSLIEAKLVSVYTILLETGI